MNTADRVEIRIGLPENCLREAAEIFYESFQQKMYPIMGSRERGVSFLQRYLNPEGAIVAMDEGQLVGIAGLQYEGCHFFSPSISEPAHEFGWLHGFMKIVRMHLFHSPDREGELYLKAIMVRSSMRGRGIGTHLLAGVSDFAWTHGFGAVRLDVEDTNPDARRCYERQGFVADKIRRCPFPFIFISRIMGFSSAITMIKKIT